MPIMTRLSRLLRADVHAVLDALEEPEALLRQAVREMDEELTQALREQEALELERKQLGRRQGVLEHDLAKIEPELNLCFEADNEALARTLLRRRLEGERLLSRLRARADALEAELGERARSLAERRERLEAMRQKAALFDAEPAREDAQGLERVSEDDVELALLREKQQRRSS